MIRLFLATMALLVASASTLHAAPADESTQKQYYEVRTYVLSESGDQAMLDRYLRDAWLPAVKRLGIGPVGVFSPAASDTNNRPMVVVVIPASDSESLVSLRMKLRGDAKYQSAAKAYWDRAGDSPVFERVSSELLVAMDCMPEARRPDGTLSNADRVFELRLYESATEKLGELKVDMFNNGEVPIFLDCGIQPIFLGQCVLGPQSPSLTYLTVYPSEETRLAAWKKFRAHPDWQVLKKVPKYLGTVSKIDKYVLRPKPYSQM
ncbi:MAG: NIPSNAP family protein [Planctomycetota bacterium]